MRKVIEALVQVSRIVSIVNRAIFLRIFKKLHLILSKRIALEKYLSSMILRITF